MTANKLVFLAAPLSALLLAACTFLVEFENKEPDELDDAGPVGVDADRPRVDAGPDAAPSDVCTGKPDGTLPGTDPLTRCCGQRVAALNTKENCGVCGITCGANQNCELVDGHYYCRGCVINNVAEDGQCATGCCSRQYDNAAGLCAASTCVTGSATCNATFCNQRGASCIKPTNASFVCVYP